jgi:hypothetical protein
MKTSSTNRAFNICFLLAFGLALWPVAVRAQTPIDCGQPISSNTVSDSEFDQYTYAGTAGQQLVVAFWSYSLSGANGQTMEADIYTPGGQLVTNVASTTGGSVINWTVPSTTNYTLLVHQSGYDATGSYSLGIQSVTGGGCESAPITCGKPVSASTTNNAETDAYSYTGAAGQQLVVAFWSYSLSGANGQTMEADIYTPGGQLVTNVASTTGGSVINWTVPSSGTYTLLVHQSGYGATGSYQIGIQSWIDGGCNSLGVIACGQTVNSATTNNVEVDAYSIDGCSNDVVILSTSGFSGSEFDLYDPNGNKLLSLSPGTSSNITFSVSGVYTLLVHSSSYNGTGSYGATLTCLSACTYTTSTVSAQPNGGWTSGGGAIRCCFPVQVCAIPDDCYNFVNWTDPNSNVVSTLPCYTFFATNSETLTANFAPTRGTTNQICGIQVFGASNVAVSAQSVAGDNYQLQSRSSMTTGSWANVSGVVLSNSPGGLIILTNSGGALGPQRFYRLDITP